MEDKIEIDRSNYTLTDYNTSHSYNKTNSINPCYYIVSLHAKITINRTPPPSLVDGFDKNEKRDVFISPYLIICLSAWEAGMHGLTVKGGQNV